MDTLEFIVLSVLLVFNMFFSYLFGITRGRNQVRAELILSKREGELDRYLEDFMNGKR